MDEYTNQHALRNIEIENAQAVAKLEADLVAVQAELAAACERLTALEAPRARAAEPLGSAR